MRLVRAILLGGLAALVVLALIALVALGTLNGRLEQAFAPLAQQTATPYIPPLVSQATPSPGREPSPSPSVAPSATATVTPRPTQSPSPTALPSQTPTPRVPPLRAFVTQVATSGAHAPGGLYIPQILAAEVVPQPPDNPGFVSSRENTVTAFRLATEYGVLGLLAHNTLAGEAFLHLQEGDVFYVIYGDGAVRPYLVTQVVRYQALQPDSPYTDFIDLQTGERLSVAQAFRRIYGSMRGGAVLQTCIARGEELSWGRLFVLARPLTP